MHLSFDLRSKPKGVEGLIIPISLVRKVTLKKHWNYYTAAEGLDPRLPICVLHAPPSCGVTSEADEWGMSPAHPLAKANASDRRRDVAGGLLPTTLVMK